MATKLKTLKDLRERLNIQLPTLPPQDVFGVEEKRLKAAAAEWVKEFEKEANNFVYPKIILEKIDWIKHFFNLTGEEKRMKTKEERLDEAYEEYEKKKIFFWEEYAKKVKEINEEKE